MASRGSYGVGTPLPLASAPSTPGVISGADKGKLDGIATGAEVNQLNDVTVASGTAALVVTNGGAGGIVAKVKAVTLNIANVVASGASGLMTGGDKAKLDQLNFPLSPLLNWLGGNVGLGSGAWTNVLSVLIDATRNRYTLCSGGITFQNTTGGAGIGYFRVRHVPSGTIIASGQIDVAAGKRATVGFAALAPFTLTVSDTVNLEARSDLAAGMNATYQIGLGDGFATTLSVSAQGS